MHVSLSILPNEVVIMDSDSLQLHLELFHALAIQKWTCTNELRDLIATCQFAGYRLSLLCITVVVSCTCLYLSFLPQLST